MEFFQKTQHLDELRNGRLGIVLRVIVAPRNLNGRSVEELGSVGYRRFEGDAVCATHIISDEKRIDVGVGIERRDMASEPCGSRFVSAP